MVLVPQETVLEATHRRLDRGWRGKVGRRGGGALQAVKSRLGLVLLLREGDERPAAGSDCFAGDPGVADLLPPGGNTTLSISDLETNTK